MENHKLVTDANAVYELDLDCLCTRWGQCASEDDIEETTGTVGISGRMSALLERKQDEKGFRALYRRESLEEMKKLAHHRLQLTGNGVTVAVLDTGAEPHPDYRERLCGFYDAVSGRSEYYDDHGHGTHVAGIIAGNGARSGGKWVGMAPGAGLYIIKVLDHKGEGKRSSFIAGCEHILRVYKKKNIRIVNISLGSMVGKNMEENSELVQTIDRLWDAGLIVCAAAGNNGKASGTVTAPGISRKIITVGSSDDMYPIRIGNTSMRDYSGRGPTKLCVMKPEIVAPGYSIVSTARPNHRSNRVYGVRSGTSMATPIVSGVLALLLEKYPEISNRDIKLLLRYSSRNLGLPREQQGWGEIDLRSLFQAAKNIFQRDRV